MYQCRHWQDATVAQGKDSRRPPKDSTAVAHSRPARLTLRDRRERALCEIARQVEGVNALSVILAGQTYLWGMLALRPNTLPPP